MKPAAERAPLHAAPASLATKAHPAAVWDLWTATATVSLTAPQRWAEVKLRGFLTAQGFEALHLNLARLHRRGQCDGWTVAVGPECQPVASMRSLTEAALRGSAARGVPGIIKVPASRLTWAQVICALVNHEGGFGWVVIRETGARHG